MNAETLLFMRENYPNKLIQFIAQNISQYTSEVINETNYDHNEVLLVLETHVKDKFKIELLKYASDKISIQRKNYSDAVVKYILKHNLDENDIPSLLKDYPHGNNEINEVIKRIALERITEILNSKPVISYELLIALLSETKLSIDNKKELVVLYLPGMNQIQAKACFQILQMGAFLSLFSRKRPKFAAIPINEKILSILRQKGWITKFEIDKDNSNCYRAIGRSI